MQVVQLPLLPGEPLLVVVKLRLRRRRRRKKRNRSPKKSQMMTWALVSS